MIRSIKHKRLKRLYGRRDESGFGRVEVRRLRQILGWLDDAKQPEELDMPGLHFHRLKGNRKGTYAVTVRANWRITWRVDEDGAFVDVNYEDYH